MATLFDLHVHTTRGSSDSNLRPEELVQEAVRLGLQGVCLTEHGGPWDRHEFHRFTTGAPVVLVRAMEVETDMGHVLVFGMGGLRQGMLNIQTLRRIVLEEDGFMVAAHPFRGLLTRPMVGRPLLYRNGGPLPRTPWEAAAHPLFELVDAIEVANGATSDEENRFALEVAHYLGLPVTGGSDAHSHHGLGRCVTVFQDPVRSEEEFLAALRARRYAPAYRTPDGQVVPFAP